MNIFRWYSKGKELPQPDQEADTCTCEICSPRIELDEDRQLEFDFPLKIPLNYSLFTQ